jgi:hypothetical protein
MLFHVGLEVLSAVAVNVILVFTYRLISVITLFVITLLITAESHSGTDHQICVPTHCYSGLSAPWNYLLETPVTVDPLQRINNYRYNPVQCSKHCIFSAVCVLYVFRNKL